MERTVERRAAPKWLKLTLRCFLALVLVAEVVLAAQQSRKGPELVRDIPVAIIQVTGASMEPVLHDGDAVLVRQVPFDELRTGDIIVFCRNDELVVHEIIELGESSAITKGAANPVPDEPVGEAEYCARMSGKVPGLGRIMNMYSNIPRFLAFSFLLILLFFGTDIFPLIYDFLHDRRGNR